MQIFTVPTLTPRLVRDQSLLDVLLGTARKLLLPTVGLDGRIEVSAIQEGTRRYVCWPSELVLLVLY